MSQKAYEGSEGQQLVTGGIFGTFEDGRQSESEACVGKTHDQLQVGTVPKMPISVMLSEARQLISLVNCSVFWSQGSETMPRRTALLIHELQVRIDELDCIGVELSQLKSSVRIGAEREQLMRQCRAWRTRAVLLLRSVNGDAQELNRLVGSRRAQSEADVWTLLERLASALVPLQERAGQEGFIVISQQLQQQKELLSKLRSLRRSRDELAVTRKAALQRRNLLMMELFAWMGATRRELRRSFAGDAALLRCVSSAYLRQKRERQWAA